MTTTPEPEPVKINQQTIDLITGRLKAFGYPDVTAEHVKKQLRLDTGADRDIIGMFAAEMLLDAGVTSWEIM